MTSLKSDCYKAGDVIYAEEPFVRILRHDLWDRVCAGCFEMHALTSRTTLKKCSGCKTLRFCGKICQKKAWPDHKLECPLLPNYTDFRHQPFVHMIGNIILKLKGKDWKTVTGRILDKEFSFDDLVSHADDTSQQNMIVDSQGIVEPLTSYIGKENMPNEATLFKLFGKVVHNRFGFACENSKSKSSEGWALFIGASKLDHSCVPNAVFNINSTSLTLRAIKTFQKSEKVTIAYRPMITQVDASLMHKAMKESFRENCYCSDCSQPFGKSNLTKILDMSKASDVLEETDCTLQLLSLLARLKYPCDVVSCERLLDLSRRQEGVLGRTNMRRMQLLAHLHFKDGPSEERKEGLLELTEAMREVWGEYYPELISIYKQLIYVNMELENRAEAEMYTRKIAHIEAVCFGKERDVGSDKTLRATMFSYLLDVV